MEISFGTKIAVLARSFCSPFRYRDFFGPSDSPKLGIVSGQTARSGTICNRKSSRRYAKYSKRVRIPERWEGGALPRVRARESFRSGNGILTCSESERPVAMALSNTRGERAFVGETDRDRALHSVTFFPSSFRDNLGKPVGWQRDDRGSSRINFPGNWVNRHTLHPKDRASWATPSAKVGPRVDVSIFIGGGVVYRSCSIIERFAGCRVATVLDYAWSEIS